jgi:hypothetical protein
MAPVTIPWQRGKVSLAAFHPQPQIGADERRLITLDLQLTDRLVVVVGAGRGLGRAITAAFAAEGNRLALLDISPEVPGVEPEISGP